MADEQQADLAALEQLPDDQIDIVETPEILNWSDSQRGVFDRPVKQHITLRLDADVVRWFNVNVKDGRRYQTDINRAFRERTHHTVDSKACR